MRRAALLALLAGCNTPRSGEAVPEGAVEVLEASAVVKSGAIGVKEKQDAHYVLVDAKNQTREDRLIAIDGNLLDEAGKVLGPLSIDELRVPAGEARTFALVFGGVAANGRSASVRVRRAAIVEHPPPIIVKDVTTEKEGAGLAALCRVENTLDRTAVVTLIASFHDDAGKILARPFVLLEIEPKGSRPFRFTGPAGSTLASVYVGEATY